MNTFGKTLATIGATWLCLLFAFLLFDYVQDVFNREWNLLFAGWSFLDIAPDCQNPLISAGAGFGRAPF